MIKRFLNISKLKTTDDLFDCNNVSYRSKFKFREVWGPLASHCDQRWVGFFINLPCFLMIFNDFCEESSLEEVFAMANIVIFQKLLLLSFNFISFVFVKTDRIVSQYFFKLFTHSLKPFHLIRNEENIFRIKIWKLFDWSDSFFKFLSLCAFVKRKENYQHYSRFFINRLYLFDFHS